MSGQERLRAAERLYWSARKMKAAGLRAQHPDWLLLNRKPPAPPYRGLTSGPPMTRWSWAAWASSVVSVHTT
jgi:hypothetical protein